MSNVKERIIGAVTVMNEKDAEKVWDLIRATFVLSNAEEADPTPEEAAVIHDYENGHPDYQPFMSQDDLLKELDL